MLLEDLQAELIRLQLHPVNLSVAAQDDGRMTLRGSLLRYWKIESVVDGPWLLSVLQGLPDVAGPEVVMNALATAQAGANQDLPVEEGGTSLRLFDPQRKPADGQPATAKKHS